MTPGLADPFGAVELRKAQDVEQLGAVRTIRDASGASADTGITSCGSPACRLAHQTRCSVARFYSDQGFPAMAAHAYSITFGDFESYYIIRMARGVLDGAGGAVKFYRNSAS